MRQAVHLFCYGLRLMGNLYLLWDAHALEADHNIGWQLGSDSARIGQPDKEGFQSCGSCREVQESLQFGKSLCFCYNGWRATRRKACVAIT